MAIEATKGVLSPAQTVLNGSTGNQPSPAQAAQQEATESPAVTRQEANKGDRLAIKKLAKEEASESQSGKDTEAQASPTPVSVSGDAAAQAQGNGQVVNVTA